MTLSWLRYAGGLALVGALGTTPATGQSCPDPARLTAGLGGPMATVRYLADDALEGRLAGSAGERCAGDYIAERFRRLGLEPAGEAAGWFQTLPVASAMNPHAPAGEGRNVIALLPGTDLDLRDEFVIVGAHYDHLGHGPFGSTRAQDGPAVHNGADDNASGVAAMLEVAELLARERPARSVLFLAFTAEESGLIGSSWFARHPTLPLENAVAMLNLDMVGRLEGDPLIVSGVGTAEEWRQILTDIGGRLGVPMAFEAEGYGPSDHTSFYVMDVPVLHFFTNVHADYHAPSDDWERIDAAGLVRVAGLAEGVVRAVAERPLRLALVRGVGTPPGQAASAGARAYLGSVPDFTPVERGVRLSGVSPGSPAEAGGLRAGDVIIRLGEREVADLQGLTDALGAYRPGDAVEVIVMRADQEVRLEVTLGSRGG